MLNKTYSRKGAFTLVELLVVISIIALLLAILMPALSKAREQAKTIICGLRQKQLGVGLVAYTNAYDGWIMPATLQYEKDGITQVLNYHNPDPNLWPKENEYWYLNLCVRKYVPDKDAFFCPAFYPNNYKDHEASLSIDTTFDKGEAFTVGMRDWSYANSTCYRSPKLLTKLPHPGEFFLLADSINKNYKVSGSIARPVPSVPSQFYRITVKERAMRELYEIGVHARHNNTAETLFADGHVERKKLKYFLDISIPTNWQFSHSKPWAGVLPQLVGYRVFDERQDEWEFYQGQYRNRRTLEIRFLD